VTLSLEGMIRRRGALEFVVDRLVRYLLRGQLPPQELLGTQEVPDLQHLIYTKQAANSILEVTCLYSSRPVSGQDRLELQVDR